MLLGKSEPLNGVAVLKLWLTVKSDDQRGICFIKCCTVDQMVLRVYMLPVGYRVNYNWHPKFSISKSLIHGSWHTVIENSDPNDHYVWLFLNLRDALWEDFISSFLSINHQELKSGIGNRICSQYVHRGNIFVFSASTCYINYQIRFTPVISTLIYIFLKHLFVFTSLSVRTGHQTTKLPCFHEEFHLWKPSNLQNYWDL